MDVMDNKDDSDTHTEKVPPQTDNNKTISTHNPNNTSHATNKDSNRVEYYMALKNTQANSV